MVHDIVEAPATETEVLGPEDENPIPLGQRISDSKAHSRKVNIPLKVAVWASQPQEIQNALLWFHQWILDNNIDWPEASEAIGKDRSTIHKILHGTYTAADWTPIANAINSFRDLCNRRASIQKNVFAHTPVTKLVFAGLDYALANNSITLIEGESRMGKSVAAQAWVNHVNHGRCVMVEVPPLGGTRALIEKIAQKSGISTVYNTAALIERILRSFNHNRILVIDEAHRALPASHSATPTSLETLRYIHDTTGAALALLCTHRLRQQMEGSTYQFEQVIGRIGMPIKLPTHLQYEHIAPILTQFVASPSENLIAEMLRMANKPGRLGLLTETLKVASRIAAKKKRTFSESHIFDAMAMREQMMGGAK